MTAAAPLHCTAGHRTLLQAETSPEPEAAAALEVPNIAPSLPFGIRFGASSGWASSLGSPLQILGNAVTPGLGNSVGGFAGGGG